MVDKVAFKFDPFEIAGVERKKGTIREVRRKVAAFVLDAVLEKMDKGTTSVSGGSWKRSLSKEYRKLKSAAGGKSFADIELSGRTKNALKVTGTPDGELELRIKGSRADIADGHNNHSGKSSLPPREFIPKRGRNFKKDIVDGIKRITRDIVNE